MSKKGIKGLLYFTIAITVLSQIEMLKLARPLMHGSWIALIGLQLIIKRGILLRIRFTFIFLAAYFAYILFCLICYFSNSIFLENHYLKTLLVPMLVTFASNLMAEDIKRQEVHTLCKVYVIGAIVYAIYVHLKYFASYKNWLSANEYIFASKNSAAQIWSTGILICILVIAPRSKNKILWYMISAYLLFVSAISQCRTALLALFIVLIVNILIHTKKKIVWITFLIALLFILYNNSLTRQFVEHVFLLDKYFGSDLNTMSSGRIDYWLNALNLFKQHPMIGVGSYYVDSSYVMVLAESGIVGFLLIEFIWGSRIILNFKHRKQSDYFIISATIFYVVESFFEGYPPFGPGVSSFMFWFLSTYTDGRELLAEVNDK